MGTQKGTASSRPTSWWLAALRRRAKAQDELVLDEPVCFASDEERRATLKFFNAAFRAEESGLTQAHTLSEELAERDPDLAETLRLYGEEEGWHRELLTSFLEHLGGQVQPMGRVTRTLYRLYGRAKRMETIVLTNLMFETIGSTTYRMTLRRAKQPVIRRMLTILTRDESFHVPLNVHFLRHALAGASPSAVRRLRRIHDVLFTTLVLLPIASRPKSKAFDGIDTLELSRAYAIQLARLFADEPDLPFSAPRPVLFALGLREKDITRGAGPSAVGIDAAERSASRDQVRVETL